MTSQEREARKAARNKVRLITNRIADVIKTLPVQDPNNWQYSKSLTMGVLARLLSQEFQIGVAQAHGIVSIYVSTRSDLYVTKGRKGGIQRHQ